MEAYRRNPVSASLLSAVEREQVKEGPEKLVVREGRYPIVTVNPRTGETVQRWTPKSSGTSILGAAGEESPSPPGLFSRIKNVFSPPEPAEPTQNKDKVVRAHALGIAHPDWTKEQIIDAVNKEMP